MRGEIVGKTVAFFEGVFADGDATGGGEVDFVTGLDGPAGGGEELVDFGAGLLFRRHWVGMLTMIAG